MSVNDDARLIERIEIEAIEILPGRRPLRFEHATRMRESLHRIGLKTPITVRYVVGRKSNVIDFADSIILVAGAHRLDAAKAIGWTHIDAFVEHGEAADDVHAQMWEIAENLHRNELSAMDRDRLLSQWIRLSKSAPVAVSSPASDVSPPQEVSAQVAAKPRSDASQVETHQASDASALSAQSEPKVSFGRPSGGVNAAARELGISRADAQRALKVDALSDEAKQAARDHGLDDNRSALLAAAKETTPAAQVEALVNRRPIDRGKLDRDLRERAISEISLLINDHIPADMRIAIRKNFEVLGSADATAIAAAILRVEAKRR